MIFQRRFLIYFACFFFGGEAAKVNALFQVCDVSHETTIHGANPTRHSLSSTFLPSAIPDALTAITESQIFNTIVPFILIDVIKPRSIRYFTPKHRPYNPVSEILRPIDAELLVHFLPELVDHPTPSFRVSGGSPPRLEMLGTGEILQASRLPSQDASFGIISEQAMKFICAGNTLARLATSEYVRLNIGSHIGHCVIADVERREVSFPSCARLISHIQSQSQLS